MSSDDPNVSDKIDILSTDDTKLKAVGEILSSDSSRQILKLLFNNSLSANKISIYLVLGFLNMDIINNTIPTTKIPDPTENSIFNL